MEDIEFAICVSPLIAVADERTIMSGSLQLAGELRHSQWREHYPWVLQDEGEA